MYFFKNFNQAFFLKFFFCVFLIVFFFFGQSKHDNIEKKKKRGAEEVLHIFLSEKEKKNYSKCNGKLEKKRKKINNKHIKYLNIE